MAQTVSQFSKGSDMGTIFSWEESYVLLGFGSRASGRLEKLACGLFVLGVRGNHQQTLLTCQMGIPLSYGCAIHRNIIGEDFRRQRFRFSTGPQASPLFHARIRSKKHAILKFMGDLHWQ